jgi:6-phosphofructokinase 1
MRIDYLSIYDRMLGTRLGAEAVELAARNQAGNLVGIIKDEIIATPYKDIINKTKPINQSLLALAEILAK